MNVNVFFNESHALRREEKKKQLFISIHLNARLQKLVNDYEIQPALMNYLHS